MKIPFRFLNKMYANLFGYFWKPCPLCGKMFGGHEAGNGYIMTTWYHGKMTCPNCVGQARAYNKAWMKNNPSFGEVINDE